MKVIGVIPSRYASTRFPGKGLADICGKPMIWWVYQQMKKVSGIDEAYLAIDHPKTEIVCQELGLSYIMTSDSHPEHISRIWEVSQRIRADYYLCVNGDEPLIEPRCIEKVIPDTVQTRPYFRGAMRSLTDPAETIDFANIKLATTEEGKCIYMSRSPVPYPRGTLLYSYKKYVGIECFNKPVLDLFVSSEMGRLERIEDIDHLRFLERGQELWFMDTDSNSLSVDTPKDLEKVEKIIRQKLDNGE